MSLPADLKASLQCDVDLSQHSTMQVGGAARYFAEPTSKEELSELLEFAHEQKLPYFILGKGSNVLFSDEGYQGLIISLIKFEQDKIVCDTSIKRVTASSGVHLSRLVMEARDAGLGGIEFLCNVPGTLGGALMMNAGYSRHADQKNEIGDLVEEVVVMDYRGQVQTLGRYDLEFSYRQSNLSEFIILQGTLQLWKRNKEEIQKKIKLNFEHRNKKQDLNHPSSGSVFKNPPAPAPAAAQLVEQVGFKGKQIGDAMISSKHANYIVNLGNAKSSDIIQLIREAQKAVFNATAIKLEPEVRIIETN